MSFRSIAGHPVEEPWTWPLRLGLGVQTLRSRWMIQAIDIDGYHHHAELAPCPGVHPETLSEALALWQSTLVPLLMKKSFELYRWQWTAPYFGLLNEPAVSYTSVQTAAEQLLLSWAQRQNPEEFALPAPMSIAGSALLALSKWDEFLQLWDQGYRVFKCKVGRQPARIEQAFLQRMSVFGGDALQLRLDANQSMTHDDIAYWQDGSRDLPIMYWEEGGVQEPLARDESLWDQDEHWPESQVWILKPTRFGLSRSIRLLKQAAADQRPCVLSNAFDSGLTLRCSAWIYAAFCAQPQALGFGTARFLPNDAWQSHSWAASQVIIPRWPFAQDGERP